MRTRTKASHPARHRTAQHDAALRRRDHAGQKRPGQIDRTLDVGPDDLVEGVIPTVRHPVVVRAYRGGVDQAVDVTDLFGQLRDGLPRSGIEAEYLGDIGDPGADTLAYLFGSDDVDQHKTGAMLRTKPCRCAANAPCCAEDQNTSPGKIERGVIETSHAVFRFPNSH